MRIADEMAETFICEDCGGTFDMGPEEDAHAEAVANFGVDGHAPGMAIVCDDCYNEIMAEHPELPRASVRD